MEKTRHVLSLVRVSGKPQIDRTGIPRQLETIADICKEENLTVAKGDRYRFEGLSGASVDKFPEYLAMLDRLSDPNISGIVFSEVSRLFRPEFADQLAISKPFRVNGKFMWYEEGVLDLRRERDIGIFVQAAMEAGSHRKRIIKWTQWGRNERRRRGDCRSDPLPEGMKFVPHPKTKDELVIGHFEYTHDFNSDRVKEAFRRVRAGHSLSQIARDLKFGKPGRPNPNVVRNVLRSHWWIGEKASLRKRENYGLREDGTMYGGYRALRKEPLIVRAKFDCVHCQHCIRTCIQSHLFPVRTLKQYRNSLIPPTRHGPGKRKVGAPTNHLFLGKGFCIVTVGGNFIPNPTSKAIRTNSIIVVPVITTTTRRVAHHTSIKKRLTLNFGNGLC
jgi:hypothetical protein